MTVHWHVSVDITCKMVLLKWSTKWSNHSAITLTLCPVSENIRGRAYWKFNSSLTQDNYFIDSLKSQIPTFAREVFSVNDPIMRWEYVKYKCREFSRSYSIKKEKERKS